MAIHSLRSNWPEAGREGCCVSWRGVGPTRRKERAVLHSAAHCYQSWSRNNPTPSGLRHMLRLGTSRAPFRSERGVSHSAACAGRDARRPAGRIPARRRLGLARFSSLFKTPCSPREGTRICLPGCGRPRPQHLRRAPACRTFRRPHHRPALLRPRTGALR